MRWPPTLNMAEEERREVRRRVGQRYELAAGGLEESA
jgi:hypothetical protein